MFEQRLGCILCWRLARAHNAIDLDQRFKLVGGRVDLQRIGNERTAVDIGGVQGLETNDLSLDDLRHGINRQLGVALRDDFAGGRMHDRLGNGAPQDVVHRHLKLFDTGLIELIDVTSRDATPLLDDDLAVLILDVERGDLATQTLRHQLQRKGFALHMEDVGVVEGIENFFGAVIQSAQKYRSGKLASTIDTAERSEERRVGK